MIDLTPEQRHKHLRTFWVVLAAGTMAAILLPALVAYLGTPPGARYIGYQYNTDDHMVYAAWMRQAMDGAFLLDNRFTTTSQPGLTVHLYFWMLGLLASVTGIPLATTIARLVLTGVFLLLLNRLVARLGAPIYTHKLALALTILGGGLGFLVWHNFGQAIIRPAPQVLSSVLMGRLPVDVWQPEAFVFPSLLTNSLFVVSLCLIVGVFVCVLDARKGWKPVALGAVAMAVLMNIHSYDVLIVALTLVGFLLMSVVKKQATPLWVMKAVLIGLGAVPAALWFVYVLRNDPVFQARAATETFSPNFRQVAFGYLPMMVLSFVGMALRPSHPVDTMRHRAGIVLLLLLFGALFAAAGSHQSGYFLDGSSWTLVFLVALVALGLLSDDRPAWNLLVAWAVVGMVALYFPALFQRKLAMGLSIPWTILAAFGVQKMLAKQDRSARNLVTVLVLIVLGATSLRWFAREMELIRVNVSNTTVHPVYLSPDVQDIREYLNQRRERTVVLAPPGISAPAIEAESEKPVPDIWGSPLIPDLNPILSGLSGVYTYAGHWSETPDYLDKRKLLERLFYSQLSDGERLALVEEAGADYIVVPVPESFEGLGLPDLSSLGRTVVAGTQFHLIELQ